MPVRSDSSCSLGKLSVDLSELSERPRLGDERGHVTRDNCHADVTRDTLCDTSSEVSDEGYKSSQGNVSAKTEENTLRLNRENTDVSVNEGECRRHVWPEESPSFVNWPRNRTNEI